MYVGIDCPAGMVYQQCGQACSQTCDHVKSTNCINTCIEGCFCPNGKVLWNGNCINATECEGTYIGTHLPFDMYICITVCSTYMCVYTYVCAASKVYQRTNPSKKIL